MKRPLILLPIVLLAALPGCGLGSDDAAPADDESDKRAVAMACLEEEGIDARLEGKEGEEDIVIGEGEGAPRIKIFLTSGLSEARQFQGRGEGAEQIGPALLYVNEGEDDVLETVENCLADL
jgi:hypothetical protein